MGKPNGPSVPGQRARGFFDDYGVYAGPTMVLDTFAKVAFFVRTHTVGKSRRKDASGTGTGPDRKSGGGLPESPNKQREYIEERRFRDRFPSAPLPPPPIRFGHGNGRKLKTHITCSGPTVSANSSETGRFIGPHRVSAVETVSRTVTKQQIRPRRTVRFQSDRVVTRVIAPFFTTRVVHVDRAELRPVYREPLSIVCGSIAIRFLRFANVSPLGKNEFLIGGAKCPQSQPQIYSEHMSIF